MLEACYDDSAASPFPSGAVRRKVSSGILLLVPNCLDTFRSFYCHALELSDMLG